MSGSPRDDEFSAFVQARQVHLRRIAYAVCGDWHQADDLLQASLVKLYVAWPRLHRNGNAEAYVRQIIVRTNISEHRRPWQRERPGLNESHDEAITGGLAFEEWSEMFEALQALPTMQRKTVLLRHWLGLSVEEAAHELGISTGTVKSHTSRALQKLQKTLAYSELR
jgi:RNA polymerase sigma-70 factor (sigma-E family)